MLFNNNARSCLFSTYTEKSCKIFVLWRKNLYKLLLLRLKCSWTETKCQNIDQFSCPKNLKFKKKSEKENHRIHEKSKESTRNKKNSREIKRNPGYIQRNLQEFHDVVSRNPLDITLS